MEDLQDRIEEITGIKMPRYEIVHVYILEDRKVLRVCVQTDCERPNDITIDEVVENYMHHNYPTEEYEILTDWEYITLNEKDIWAIPTEF